MAEDMSVVHVADLETGIVQRFAGSYDDERLRRCLGAQFSECSGDGGPAVDALLDQPEWLAACPDGNVYLFDSALRCLRRVNADGIIDTVGGQCGNVSSNEPFVEGPALDHPWWGVNALACAPEGDRLYVALANQVMALMLPAPGLVTGE